MLVQISPHSVIESAGKIRNRNEELTNELKAISNAIAELEVNFKSKDGVAIREEMTKFTPRVNQYKGVVESYCEFMERSAISIQALENALSNNVYSVVGNIPPVTPP